jgi:hypothetical protein
MCEYLWEGCRNKKIKNKKRIPFRHLGGDPKKRKRNPRYRMWFGGHVRPREYSSQKPNMHMPMIIPTNTCVSTAYSSGLGHIRPHEYGSQKPNPDKATNMFIFVRPLLEEYARQVAIAAMWKNAGGLRRAASKPAPPRQSAAEHEERAMYNRTVDLETASCSSYVSWMALLLQYWRLKRLALKNGGGGNWGRPAPREHRSHYLLPQIASRGLKCCRLWCRRRLQPNLQQPTFLWVLQRTTLQAEDHAASVISAPRVICTYQPVKPAID